MALASELEQEMPLENNGLLVASGISKAYGPTIALDHADLTLRGGEVHALLGENGAGKSTVVRILTGATQPDSGDILLDGVPYQPTSIEEARKNRVATAFQELSLVPNLTVAQNLLLPHLSKGLLGMVSSKKDVERAAEYLAEVKLERINPNARVGSLALAERQRIEIARALRNGSKVLILDEPTASLAETDWLFEQIALAVSKNIAVLYISHRLAEVRQICRSATVLRNGKTIASVALDQASDSDIFEMMVGRKNTTQVHDKKQAKADANVRMAVAKLSGQRIRDVSFQLREGEVLGIAALEGQGQQSLFRTLAGLEPIQSGTVTLDDKPYAVSSPRQALKFASGVAYLPEERKTEGILGGMSAASNVVLPLLAIRSGPMLVNERLELRLSRTAAESVDMAPRYLRFAISDLSGGNQQKALIARVLATGASTLLLFDPTRGVDVGTKASIYQAISEFVGNGGSVLFYSSELPEIVHLADRCMVLHNHSLAGIFTGDDITEQTLVAAMTGHKTSSNTTVL